MNPTATDRIGYLDSGRAILILLGVPFHVSLIYHPAQFWPVHAAQVSAVLGWFGDFLHYFRMHAFFLVSGFFASLQLAKTPHRGWLRRRLIRLGVPLLAAALLLNPLQMLGMAVGEADGWNAASASLWLARLRHLGEPWVAHLWFLVVLLIYSLGAAAIWPLIPARGEPHPTFRPHHPGTLGAMVLMALGFVGWRLATAALARLTGNGLLLADGALRLDYALFYLPYFVLGAVLERRRGLLDRLRDGGRFTAPFGIAAFVAAQLLWQEPGVEMLVLSRGLQGLSSFLLCAALFHLLMRHLDLVGRRLRGVAAAAFTIYLFHHPMIVWLGLAVGDAALPPTAGFLLITAITVTTAYALHVLVIKPSPALSFLFNGVVPKRRPPVAGAAE